MAFTDNFTRADNADLGTDWTPVTGDGTFKIASNTATPTSLAADAAERWSTNTFANDQYSQATISAISGVGTDEGIGVCIRASNSARTYYRAVANTEGAGVNTYLGKVVAGTYSQLATGTVAWAAGDIIKIEISSNTLTCYRNGVSVCSVGSETSIPSGWAGVSFSSDMNTSAFSAWEGGDVGGGGDTLWAQSCM